MKKLLACTALAMASSLMVMAQNKADLRFSIGPELDFATGTFSNTHSVGIGATVQAEKFIQQNLYGTGTIGIVIFNGKSIGGTNVKFTGQTIIPLKIGVKYFLAGGLYGAAQIGAGFLSNFAKGTAFAYTPQLGYEFQTKTGRAADIAIKYDGYSKNGTIGALGLRVAYIF